MLILSYPWGSLTEGGIYIDPIIKIDLIRLRDLVNSIYLEDKTFMGFNESGIIVSSNFLYGITQELNEIKHITLHNLNRIDDDINTLKSSSNKKEYIGEELYLFYDLLPNELKEKLKIYIIKNG